MIKKLRSHIQDFRRRPLIFFLVVSFGIACIHLAVVYTLLKPSFWPFSSCAPNFLSFVLNPGALLMFFFLNTSAKDVTISFLAMTVSSILYGIGGGLLFSPDKKTAQPIGIILLGLLLLAGFLVVSLVGLLCGLSTIQPILTKSIKDFLAF